METYVRSSDDGYGQSSKIPQFVKVVVEIVSPRKINPYRFRRLVYAALNKGQFEEISEDLISLYPKQD